jgi:hypothetical protein
MLSVTSRIASVVGSAPSSPARRRWALAVIDRAVVIDDHGGRFPIDYTTVMIGATRR